MTDEQLVRPVRRIVTGHLPDGRSTVLSDGPSPNHWTSSTWLALPISYVIDLATREVIGYSMADHHRADLVVDALDMAPGQGYLEDGCTIHTDRGSEYTSTQFRDQLRESGRRQSMGGPGSASTVRMGPTAAGMA